MWQQPSALGSRTSGRINVFGWQDAYSIIMSHIYQLVKVHVPKRCCPAWLGASKWLDVWKIAEQVAGKLIYNLCGLAIFNIDILKNHIQPHVLTLVMKRTAEGLEKASTMWSFFQFTESSFWFGSTFANAWTRMCQMARMIQQMPCPQSPICKENLGKHLDMMIWVCMNVLYMILWYDITIWYYDIILWYDNIICIVVYIDIVSQSLTLAMCYILLYWCMYQIFLLSTLFMLMS